MEIAVLVELGRIVIARQRAHPDFGVPALRPCFLGVQNRLQQKSKRQKQDWLEPASKDSRSTQVHLDAPSALESAARRVVRPMNLGVAVSASPVENVSLRGKVGLARMSGRVVALLAQTRRADLQQLRLRRAVRLM